MSAADHLQAGEIAAAIEAAVKDVKTAPRNVNARIFLFELLAATGQWDRAKTHLDVLADQAATMIDGIGSYAGVLAAERARARLFGAAEGAPEQVTPLPLDPGETLGALQHFVAGRISEARAVLDARDERTPALRAVVDGTPADDLRDADDLLGPVFELVSQGRYGWVPMNEVERVEFDPPKLFRDTIWRPGALYLAGGLTCRAFFPVRYPGSEKIEDDTIRLGRATDWVETGNIVRGVGQRGFVVGDELRYLLDIGEIVIDRATGE